MGDASPSGAAGAAAVVGPLPVSDIVLPGADDSIVLEGYMLKQASRLSQKFFHKRYFVLRADNTLEYYKDEKTKQLQQYVSGKCRGSFPIRHDASCEVSDLYIEKHQRDWVYCLRVQIANNYYEQDEDLDNSSLGDVSRASRVSENPTPASPLLHNNSGNNTNTANGRQQRRNQVSSPFRSKNKISDRRRSRSDESAGHNTPSRLPAIGRSDEAETAISTTSKVRRRPRFLARARSLDNGEVPHLVEVEQQQQQQQSPTRPARTTDEDDEQDYLRTQYITTRKQNQRKTKEKVVQGTKLVAAAGATVGVAIVTAGIGLVAGVIALGVAGSAVGGGAAFDATWKDRSNRRTEIVIASASYDTIRQWKSILDAALESDRVQKSTWGEMFANDGRKTRAAVLPTTSRGAVLKRQNSCRSVGGGGGGGDGDGGPGQRSGGVYFANNARWVPLEGGLMSIVSSGFQGLRVFREERYEAGAVPRRNAGRRLYTQLSVEDKPCSPMKAHTVLSTSPLEAFLCLMSHGRVLTRAAYCYAPETEHRVSFEVIESIDEHTDIIHMVFRPLFLFPSWTNPRDFSLYRYWRLEEDGRYVVCYESVDHPKVPVTADHVRGEMHSVFTIAPQKKPSRKRAANRQNLPPECLMTATVQVDPRGWVPTAPWSFFSNQAYADAFGIAALLQLVDIRDAIDQDRFVSVATENNEDSQNVLRDGFRPYSNAGESPPAITRNLSADTADDTLNEDVVNYDFAYAGNESSSVNLPESPTGIASRPPLLISDMWAEPDSNSFRVRGFNYKSDKKKYNAGPSIGRLVAVDVVSVDKPLYSGFTVHPTERVQLALQKEKELLASGGKSDMPEFLFVVNIVLPGPPFYHGVYYYAIDDMCTINGSNGSPSSKLCRKFFFGDSDEFRDRTFKLIPQIVQGNFIVSKAVGSTPAIMGKKLRQLYVKSDRFFEVILDCGSSPVATGVIRLSLGYAKTLVVDMGFLFEGDEEEYLPERIFGSVRMKNIDFGPQLRHVASPPGEEDEPFEL